MPTCTFTASSSSDLSAHELWTRIEMVENWASFTPTVTSAHILGGAPLIVGSKIVMNQPGAPETVWNVTKLTKGRTLTYERRGAGMRTIAHYVVDATASGNPKLVLSFTLNGPLAKFWSVLMGKKFRECLAIEAEGLAKSK